MKLTLIVWLKSHQRQKKNGSRPGGPFSQPMITDSENLTDEERLLD